MDRDQILHHLRGHIAALRELGVRALAIFGPAARNEGQPGSPVDFLIQFDPPHTFDQFLEVKRYLTDQLQRPIELVVASPYHPEIRPYIEGDAVEIIGLEIGD